MKHGIILLIVAGFSMASTGCGMMESGKKSMRQMTQMFRPNPFDEPLRPDTYEDEWGFVGAEGRADRERERDPDRWWQNLVMSPEARSIERNLGID